MAGCSICAINDVNQKILDGLYVRFITARRAAEEARRAAAGGGAAGAADDPPALGPTSATIEGYRRVEANSLRVKGEAAAARAARRAEAAAAADPDDFITTMKRYSQTMTRIWQLLPPRKMGHTELYEDTMKSLLSFALPGQNFNLIQLHYTASLWNCHSTLTMLQYMLRVPLMDDFIEHIRGVIGAPVPAGVGAAGGGGGGAAGGRAAGPPAFADGGAVGYKRRRTEGGFGGAARALNAHGD